MKIEFQKQFGKGTDPWYAKAERWVKKKFNNYFHSFHFNPVAGRLLVFPSHLEHHVDFNESQEDRISVSFNVRLEE